MKIFWCLKYIRWRNEKEDNDLFLIRVLLRKLTTFFLINSIVFLCALLKEPHIKRDNTLFEKYFFLSKTFSILRSVFFVIEEIEVFLRLSFARVIFLRDVVKMNNCFFILFKKIYNIYYYFSLILISGLLDRLIQFRN